MTASDENFTYRPASNMQDAFENLITMMRILRSENGCPWDRDQTHETLLPHFIEEAYELMEAVRTQDVEGLKDELGDLLLHVVFHAQLASETKQFTIFEVIQAITDKLHRRHPHVFGDQQEEAKDPEAVKKLWAKVKRKEGKESLLGGIPSAMPALHRAWRIGDKVSTVGFDWSNPEEVLEKVQEELDELKEACHQKKPEKMAEEFGDLAFSLVQVARFLKLDPELTLQQANDKFTQRFSQLETSAKSQGRHLTELSLKEMEKLWQSNKKA